MIDSIASSLAEVVRTNAWLAPLAALLGGLLTAANPCVLAMAPLMVAYVAGQETKSVRRSFLLSLAFTLGLTLMFLVLFLVTWAASSFLRASWWTYVAAGVCLLMGLHLLEVIRWNTSAPASVRPRSKGFPGAVGLGILFGLVSLPCAGPVLLALLALVPVRGAAYGGALLAAYSVGHCGLVLVGGTSMALVQRLVDSRGWSRGIAWTRAIAGAVICVIGLYLLFA